MMKRAYATIEIKAAGDGGKRTFSGIATTPATDRMGDIVEPKGAIFKLPIPLLWQHNSAQPIGWVRSAKVTRDGIAIEGEVADIPEDGKLKERLAEAWQSIKSGLVRGLSIGFAPLEVEPIDPKSPWGPSKFLSWEWLELSAVTIPANQEASITAIKSIDERLRKAAPGRAAPASSQPARAGAHQSKGTEMKFTQEALSALQEQRQTKAARMAELLEVKKANGTFSEDERAEFNGLDAEIENLDDEIRVTQRHVSNIATLKSVDDPSSGSRGPTILMRKADPDPQFKGEAVSRMLLARAAAFMAQKDGIFMRPSEFAERRWGQTHKQLIAVMKANEVLGGGTGSGEWGAELVQVNTQFQGDFIEYLYSKTVFDRLPLREVPARVTIKGQDGAASGFWVGESKAIKVTTGDFSNVNTTPYKVGSIAVMSKELVEDSSPSVVMLMRDSIEEGLRQRVDSTFLSATAASSGVSPAGLLNGLSAVAASNGPDEQSARTDYRALMAPFITAKNVGGLWFVTTPTLAVGLGSMVNALGQPSFPGITVEGGTYMGYPMITGDNVGSGDILLLKPSDIWKIGDMGVQFQLSDTAMIEQSSAPTGETDTPTAASATLTSMFQEDSVAIKATRRISFGKRRSSAVQWIDDAAYGAENS